jgi:hypothetical protein
MASLVIVVMAGEWILLVAGTRLHEMLAGAVSIAAAYVFFSFVYRSERLHTKMRAADLATGWRIPGYIAVDTWVVVKILFQDLFSICKASSLYRVSDFKTSKEDPYLTGRRVLATIFTSASPNSIVIGIDSEQNRMLFHQLQRTGLSKIDQALGAQPCKSG